jgi:hypothetical protein
MRLQGVPSVKTKRAAIYVRVSTNDQDTGLQETELREYVESRGWSCTVYRDQGQSGAKNERPALTALLNDLRRRKADVVVVWALDRLARSLKHLLTIAEECQLLGVDLVSLRQNIDTTLPAGRLTFAVLGAVAEFEREMLRERVKALASITAETDGPFDFAFAGAHAVRFSIMESNQVSELLCAICDQPIKLEIDRDADGVGRSVHEACSQLKVAPAKKRPMGSFGESKFDCSA